MKFSSCIEIATDKSDEDNGIEYGLCESEFVLPENSDIDSNWLLEVDLDQLMNLEIKVMQVSDGSDIWGKKDITTESQQIFTSVSIPFKPGFKKVATEQWFDNVGVEENEFYSICIWYELIKLLSGGRVRCSVCENVIDFTKFVCHTSETSSKDNQINLVMELRSGNIVRKLAQFTLEMVKSGEIDLFLLSSRMFESQQRSNDIIYKLLHDNKENKDRIDTFIAEKNALDVILEQRDSKTRTIMVDLLNEKKKKIVELETKLLKFELRVSDSDLINKYVTDAVSELNSPGKRKRKFGTEFRSLTSSARKKKVSEDEFIHSSGHSDLERKRVKKEVDQEFTGFDNTKYMGINKRLKFDQFDPITIHHDDERSADIKEEEEGERNKLVEENKASGSFDNLGDKDNYMTDSDENSTDSVTETTKELETGLKKDKLDNDESSTEEETDTTPNSESEEETDAE